MASGPTVRGLFEFGGELKHKWSSSEDDCVVDILPRILIFEN